MSLRFKTPYSVSKLLRFDWRFWFVMSVIVAWIEKCSMETTRYRRIAGEFQFKSSVKFQTLDYSKLWMCNLCGGTMNGVNMSFTHRMWTIQQPELFNDVHSYLFLIYWKLIYKFLPQIHKLYLLDVDNFIVPSTDFRFYCLFLPAKNSYRLLSS